MSGYHDDPEQVTETLSAYLDGALPDDEREALERHLDGCADCQRELAGLARVGALLRALPEPDLPRSFILPETATRRATAAPRAPAWTRAVQWAGGLAAAFGLGLLVLGALPHIGPATASFSLDRHTSSGAGGATSAPADAPATAPATATATPDNVLYAGSPAATGGTPQVTATPTTTPAPTPSVTPVVTYGPAFGGHADQGGTSAPLEPVGAVLLIGGGAALTAGTVRRRRSRRTQGEQP